MLALSLQKLAVLVDGGIDALEIKVFGLGSRIVEGEPFERADLRNDAKENREDASADPRASIVLPPFFFVIGAPQVVKELPLREVRLLAHHVFLVRLQRHLRHLRDQPAHRPTVGSNRQIFVRDHVFEFDSIDNRKRTLQ